MRIFLQCTTFAMLLLATSLPALEPLKPLRADAPPIIDGVLDDPVWQQAPCETGFITYYPDYGVNMSEQTRVWYAYDRENLFFAFKCHDSQPDKIKASVTARDKIRQDDWICINLDTFNDQQTLYVFYTNPAGIQMDSRATSTEEDESVDFVWYSHARIDSQGYAVELKIPFKSLRYSGREPVTMGIIFERYISRNSQAGTYPALNPKQGGNFVTQTRPLEYQDIAHYRLVEILPALTYSHNRALRQGKLAPSGDNRELSLTTKYGLTSHLVLDATLNPDFSQVEADAGQVDFNLRYALFYPEKRPFFLEGKENFGFGGSTAGDPLGAVVHTRTIVNPLAGIKLTGKIGAPHSLACIYALDELPEAQQPGEYAHFPILRYKRALHQNSFIGGFYTGREAENSYNRVLGADGQFRLNPSSFLGWHGFFSQTDHAGQKDNGHALGTNYYYRTRDWFINLRLHDLSDGFRTETGYVTRTGITRIRAGVIRSLYPGSKILLRLDPLLNNQFIRDKASGQWENDNQFFLTFILPRSSNIRAGYSFSQEIFLTKKFPTSYVNVSVNSQLTKQLYGLLSYKYGQKIRYLDDPYPGKGSDASASIVYQPSEKFSSTLSLAFSDFLRTSNLRREFDYTIVWFRTSYQMNKYLFFRVILEYNSFYQELTTDWLASFTYIPGTVIHLGYGALYEKIAWQNDAYLASDRFLETKRSFFFKMSYLWRW